MFQLSVVIPAFNEEHNIERCLASVCDVADEIIVVDSESTDRTREICKSFDARVLVKPWEGYSPAKNFGALKAAHDMILSIDADEALSDELRQSIARAKASGEAQGYSFRRLTSYCGQWMRHCGWYPDIKCRIYDRRRVHWEGLVHERLAPDVGRVELLEGDLLHYSFRSLGDYVQKMNRYSELTAQQAFERGRRCGWPSVLVIPPLKFLKCYLIKRGFLDGYYGFVVSRMAAVTAFLKYAKLRELSRGGRRVDSDAVQRTSQAA